MKEIVVRYHILVFITYCYLFIQKVYILDVPPVTKQFEKIGAQKSDLKVDENLVFFTFGIALPCMIAPSSSLLSVFEMIALAPFPVGKRWQKLMSSRLMATPASLAIWITVLLGSSPGASSAPKIAMFLRSPYCSIASALRKLPNPFSC